MQMQQILSYLTGLGGLAVMWIVILISTGKHPWTLVIGEDGQPSTSKFQMMVWTGAVVFAFLAVYQLRFGLAYIQEFPGFPRNLLIAMGISVVTAVSAKSIAVNAQSKKDAAESTDQPNAAAQPVPSKSGILTDDSGTPDLGKVQVVLWTIIAVGVFLSQVFSLINASYPSASCPAFTPKAGVDACAVLSLPDIGATLMILMGLGHGAYLGKKIAES
jgi:hypothetical protein